MDATVTKIVNTRRLSAIQGLVFGLIFSLSVLSLSAQARQINPSNNNDLIFVQIPNLNSPQQVLQQPVITPGNVQENEFSKVSHLWPRSIYYTMETDGLKTQLQSNMQIAYQYNYSFTFELGARTAQGREIAIPDGWYQLQVAVIKKSGEGLRGKQINNPFERYVTSTSMFLPVMNGSFGRKISLVFPDIRETALVHHLFVELIPLKEECDDNGTKINCISIDKRGQPDAARSILEPRPGYKTYLFEMPFTPFIPKDGMRRDPSDLNDEDQAFLGGSLAKYIARAQLYRQRGSLQKRAATTPADHAAKHNLTLISANDEGFAQVGKELNDLLDYRANGVGRQKSRQRPLFIALCKQIVSRQADFEKKSRELGYGRQVHFIRAVSICANNPEKYLQLNRVVHAGRPIAGKIERLAEDTLNYTVMANFMSSRSHSVDTFTSVTVKPPTIVAKFLDMIGVGLGHGVSYGNSRSRAESGIASLSTALDFNYVIFNVPSTGAQKCLEVRVLPEASHFLYAPEAPAGIYVCADKQEGVTYNPVLFAHAFQRCKTTTMVECNSLVQKLNVSLRGDSEVTGFFYAIRKGIRPDHDNHVQPFGDMEKAEKYFANIPTTDDMEIVNPIDIGDDNAPSFLRQISFQYEEKFN